MRLDLRVCSVIVSVVVGSFFAACGSQSGGGDLGNGDDSGGVPLDDSASTNDGVGFDIGSDATSAGFLSIAFDPPAATITVDGTATPKTTSFTLNGLRSDGSKVPISAESLAFDRPDLAKTTPGVPVVMTASGALAGVGTLHAVYKGLVANAKLTVAVKIRDVSTDVDLASLGVLDAPPSGADTKLTTLLYPYDATVFPLGINAPLLMWNAPEAKAAYRVHLEEKNYVYDGFFSVASPAQLRVPQKFWDTITASNTGDPLVLTLTRFDSPSGKALTSVTQKWTIAPASLRGAIYYWTTSAGGHMARIRPGTGATPEVINGGKCMGCHAVSADGSTLVAAVEGLPTTDGSGDNRPWVSFDLPTATVRATSGFFAGNVAVNPDGKYTVFGSQKLRLGDTKTGLEVAGSGLDAIALDPGSVGLMTPAFSPDGKHLAAVEGSGSWYHNLMNGKLVTLDFDEATHTFSGLKGLVAASTFPAAEHAIAYPTWTPDSSSIAFHVGDYDTGCDAQGCDAAAKQLGEIWMQNASGAAATMLSTLSDGAPNAADHNVAYEPTFNPVERGGYFWVVFTSSRDWGNRITGVANNGKKRLWVAAIDKASGAADPSHPPFFLDGQEEATTNMRGFWALAACTPTKGGGACAAGFECCSGFCDKGVCIDVSTESCKDVGVTCTVDAECCNAPYVKCEGGKCAPVKPK